MSWSLHKFAVPLTGTLAVDHRPLVDMLYSLYYPQFPLFVDSSSLLSSKSSRTPSETTPSKRSYKLAFLPYALGNPDAKLACEALRSHSST